MSEYFPPSATGQVDRNNIDADLIVSLTIFPETNLERQRKQWSSIIIIHTRVFFAIILQLNAFI